jgi:iron complex transport system substrate-binding protein
MLHRLITLIALIALLAACSAPAAVQPTALPQSAPAAESAAFPVSIEHTFGTTTIVAAPQRVIALGYNEQDAILALGVTPVAVRYWFGDESRAVFPWAEELLGDAQPEVLNMPFGELNYEQIAALQPDLISAVYSGISDAEFANLSKIAPVIAQPEGYVNFGTPWQEMTLTIGKALGRETQAQALVDEVTAQFTQIRDAHPEFAGQTVVVGAPSGDGQFGFVASQDPRARVFSDLGFVVPEELDAVAGEQFFGSISLERVDLLEQDLLAFHQLAWVEGGRASIEADPILSQLNAMREGRAIYFEGVLDDALQFSTVLSLPYVLRELVPMLEQALGGAAAMEVEATGTRSFTDDLGRTVELPANPQRVVILDPSIHISHMIALGVTPIGATLNPSIEGGAAFSPLWGEAATTMEPLGEVGQPNLERLAALKPDLILYAIPYSEQNLDVLSQIAPVVAYNMRPGIEDSLRFVAEVLGREEEADAVLAGFNAQIAQAKTALGWEGKNVAVAAHFPDEPKFTVYGPGSRLGDIVTQLGATLVPAEIGGEAAKPYNTDIGMEAIAELLQSDALILLRYSMGPNSDSTFESWLNSPIWQQLPAVQSGNYAILDIQEGNANLGIAGVEKALADLQEQLAGE